MEASPHTTRDVRTTLRAPLSVARVLIVLKLPALLGLVYLPLLLSREQRVVPSLLFFALVLLGSAAAAVWRSGLTVDRARRRVRLWSGPVFPLRGESLPLRAFHTVSVGLEQVESRRRWGLALPPRQLSVFPVRLQQDLTREQWEPSAPPPLVRTVVHFERYEEALAFAQQVAEATGLKLRDDCGPGPR